MLALLLASAVAGAQPPDDACAQVRAVQGYARAAQLGTTTLDELERRLCGDTQRTGLGGPYCEEARLVERVARIGGLDDEPMRQLEQARQLACAGQLPERFSWNNGVSARSPNGAWSYPNAVTARSPNGALSYPNAVTARAANGAWSYPNAVTARAANGRWSRPDAVSVGDPGALLLWACGRRDTPCGDAAERLVALSEDERAAALVEQAWAAR